jgi:peptidylprolyl isomerase/FKBP-type peptidyl-prolyl cis-trans isomerase FkpA
VFGAVRRRKGFALKRLIACAAVAAPLFFLAGCGSNSNPTSSDGGQLIIQDVVVGTGATAAVGDTVTVDYVGTFTDGTVFDASSMRAPGTYTFPLGAGQVIQGWDQGIVGMRVGGERKLTIPPNLAYGALGRGVIPPNTTLLFDIKLLSIAGK